MTKRELLDKAYQELASVTADNSFGLDTNINRVIPKLYNTLRLVCAYLQELEDADAQKPAPTTDPTDPRPGGTEAL